MSYERTNWTDKTFVAPTIMNHLEEGVENLGNDLQTTNDDLTKLTKRVDNMDQQSADSKFNYSYEEQVGGRWVDGKIWYYKTFVFNSPKVNAENAFNEKLDFDEIICMDCIFQRIDGKYYSIAYGTSNNAYSVYLQDINPTGVWFVAYGGIQIKKAILTVKYTKKDDTN